MYFSQPVLSISAHAPCCISHSHAVASSRREHICQIASLFRNHPWAGPLLEQPLTVITDGLYTYAVAHFVFAKAILPLLKDSPDSAYIIITGAGGIYSWPVCACSMTTSHIGHQCTWQALDLLPLTPCPDGT